MNEENKQENLPPRGQPRRRSYSPEVRRKAVQLALEEKYPAELICQQMGMSEASLTQWVRRYQQMGEAGLHNRPHSGRGKAKLAAAVKEKIVQLKTEQPSFGVKRISQWLARVLFLRASPETVRRTLHQEKLLDNRKPKPKRNPPKPRFFERATPNQMWQSDICTFRLGGANAYLIGFIDDHSRYIVGLGLYRSQTTEHVLEVYRRAVADYGAPKEMLTDNGRQYVSWHGKTRFQHELAKDRVHHIRSAPHHPMTLGKIERFWKTIWDEFLVRAQMESFEQACQRVALWVKYYNHKRPHQGLEGMCPADRFFSIQKQMRELIEKGIAENIQELALRGAPKDPLYVVGRVGGQSLVIEAVDGKLTMSLDGDEQPQSATADKSPTGETHEQCEQRKQIRHGGQVSGEVGGQVAPSQERASLPQCAGASGSGALGLDRQTAAQRGMPANADQRGGALAVGAEGVAGDARSALAPGAGGVGNGTESGSQAQPTAGSTSRCGGGQTGALGEAIGAAPTNQELERRGDEKNPESDPGCAVAPMGGDGGGGAQRQIERQGGGQPLGGQPQDVLQKGSSGALGLDRCAGSQAGRSTHPGAGPGKGETTGAARTVAEGKSSAAPEPGDPASAGGA